LHAIQTDYGGCSYENLSGSAQKEVNNKKQGKKRKKEKERAKHKEK